jgi:hypothetical protein
MASEGYALNNVKKDSQTKIEGINTKQQGMKPDVMALMEERQSLLSNAEALEKEIGVMFRKAHCMFEKAQSIGRQISRLSAGIPSIRTTKYNRVFNENGRVPRLWERGGIYYVQTRIQKKKRRFSLHTSSLEAAIPEAEILVRKIKSGEVCLYKRNDTGRENASVNFLNAMVAVEAIRGLKPQQT